MIICYCLRASAPQLDLPCQYEVRASCEARDAKPARAVTWDRQRGTLECTLQTHHLFQDSLADANHLSPNQVERMGKKVCE